MIMKRILLFTAFILLCISSNAETLNVSYYLDFGRNDDNGHITVSPDINNNYWNNITDIKVTAPAVKLRNSVGVLSSIDLTITSAFLQNGIAQGGLLTPSASLLGDFAIATATEDYFYVEGATGKGGLKLTGLNPSKVYVFKIFGTRNTTEARTSQYKITGTNTSIKTLQTSGAAIGYDNYNGNNNTIVVSDKIMPTSTGTIDIELTKTVGNFGYIGIIKIEEYTPSIGYTLENVGFETGNLDSWNVAGSNVTNLVTNTIANTGKYSLKVTGQSEEISQTITYQTGNAYKLSGHIYQSSAAKLTTDQSAFLLLSFYDENNILLSAAESAPLTNLSELDKWIDFEVAANVPQKTQYIKAAFVWKSNTSGSVYFDDIKLQEYVPLNENWTKLYIDLGPGDGVNGNITKSPDANGNSWNNLTNGTTTAETVKLLDYTNKSTGASVNVTKSFSTNGILHGGLLSPSVSLLGEYAINTATQDYFFVDNNSGMLEFSGLQKNKKYVFHFFGSRENSETRIAEYILTGANFSSKTLLTSGTGVGNGGYNANNNSVVSSDTLYVDMNGIITLEVKKSTGTYGHLNIIKIEAFDNTSDIKYTIDNQGFEYGDLRFWTKEASSVQSAAEVNKEYPNKGVYSLKFAGDNVTLSQKIAYINNNNFYKVSGYFYKSSALDAKQSAFLSLSYFDSSNRVISSVKSGAITVTSEANKWLKLETYLEVPAGTKYIQAEVNWVNTDKSSGSVYFDDLGLEPFVPLSPLKIAYFGSSVPYGQGATNKVGYTSLYTSILNARAQKGAKAWQTVNISVPGDNTVKVLARYNSDLLPQKAKYVVFALALGNEGIHENGQPAFDQFKNNMKVLIDRARADGFTPIVTNSYTRNDYNATDYNYIKQMNLLIHSWNVPSVNLLGAVDDLAGRWVDGYWDDALHPNDAGHEELSYTIVPSLFDALDAEKPVPKKVNGSSVTFTKASSNKNSISFTPENIVHPFTVAFSFKATASGTLIQLKDAKTDSVGNISILNGVIRYNSAKGGSIVGSVPVRDGQWHKVILTHYYAKGITILYCDSISQGEVKEKLIPTNFKIGGLYVPERLEYKNLLFYRSAMNADEAKYIARDSLLKSSLELFAPLDGKRVNLTDSLANLAQSTNSLIVTRETVVAPIDFSLNKSNINEKNELGYVVSYFVTQYANQMDNATYSLVSGKDDTDNQFFTIEGNLLKAAVRFDYDQKQAYTIRVRSTSTSGGFIEKTFVIKINSLAKDITLKPATILTPNGDGINDTWIITNIEEYKESEVSVFDQAGKRLFTQKKYDNTWSGESLKPGTYFYLIIPAPSQKPIKGYLTILR